LLGFLAGQVAANESLPSGQSSPVVLRRLSDRSSRRRSRYTVYQE
jgi:hypothetical protein